MTSIEDRISQHYSSFSTKLREAADYLAANPLDVATRSLRSVAQDSQVSPATFSRLARALGFADYEALREAGRASMGNRMVPFSERAEALRHGDQSAGHFLNRQASACLRNISAMEQTLSPDTLQGAVDTLAAADRVLLIGALGSAGIIDYFAYQAQFFTSDWQVAGRSDTSVAASYAQMAPGDAVIALTKTPYAEQTLQALRVARANSLQTIVLTDGHASPALAFADHFVIIPSETANFFSSYAATLVVIETIMSMLVAKAGPEAEARIRATEEQMRKLRVNRTPP